MDFNLGDSYTLLDSERAPKDFAMCAKRMEQDVETDGVYAYISSECTTITPLYKGTKNYIMTSRGDTFANVSFR